MKNFLLKFLIVIKPILILLITLEFLNRQNDNSSIYYQKKFIEKNKDFLEGVIFGPSHIWRGIQPKYLDYKVASLAMKGSRPNIDYLLYEYTKEIAKPNFYIFDLSLRYLEQQNNEDWIKGKKLPYYFHNINREKLGDFFLTTIPLKENITLYEKKYDKWGFQLKIPKQKDIFKQLNFQDSLILQHSTTKKILARHNTISKNNKTILNKNLYEKIIAECANQDIKIIFISTPKYHHYNKGFKQKYTLERRNFLNQVVDNKTVFFLNFETFNENNPHLFFNINHMNPEGAKIFSQHLSQVLKTILQKN